MEKIEIDTNKWKKIPIHKRQELTRLEYPNII